MLLRPLLLVHPPTRPPTRPPAPSLPPQAQAQALAHAHALPNALPLAAHGARAVAPPWRGEHQALQRAHRGQGAGGAPPQQPDALHRLK